ncbi:hypothetical protein ABZ806_20550 [Spirillospora sp. NPDC047418]
MHRLFRNAARVAALAIVIVGSGAVAAIPPAIADIGADMRLVCSDESGAHQVGLRIETTAPSSGIAGQPIQLGTVKVDVALPPELVKVVRTDSLGGSAAPPMTSATPSPTAPPALSGVAEMRVAIHEPGRDQHAGWPAFALATAPSRGDGVVHLTGSGVAPPVVPQSPGGLSWSAREMDLSLVTGGTAAEQGAVQTALHCAAEKEFGLGTVRVGRGNEAAVPSALSAPSSQPAASQENLCTPTPAPGEDPRYAVNHEDAGLEQIYQSPEPPKNPKPIELYQPGTMYCIKGAGFVNAKKVGNAVPISVESSARFSTANFFSSPVLGPNYRELRGYSVNRTYPTPATVLGFGFMPTRAVAEAVQVGAPGKENPITGNLRLIQQFDHAKLMPGIAPDQLRASSYVRIKAVEAQVNGVPLDLGDECMTSSTLFKASAFLGNLRTGILNFDEGETLTVDGLEIPSFSGCGVTEDLSPILTASVSGSGNYASVETGHWCTVAGGANCVDGAGTPPPNLTVIPAGDTTATMHPFVLNRMPATSPEQAQFRCESATMRFHFDSGHWQSRFMLAKGGMSFKDCKVKASDGTEYPVVEASQDGPIWLLVRIFEDPMRLEINGFMFSTGVDTDGDGSADCSFQINSPLQYSPIERQLGASPGRIRGQYVDGKFSVIDHNLEVASESTCNLPGFERRTPTTRITFDLVGKEFTFSPAQQIIWDRPRS